MTLETKSRAALRELIQLLQDVDAEWCGEARNLTTEEDVVGSHRALMHILEAGLVGYFEQDASRPDFRRIVTPSRKLTGDNSDAIYFDAPVDPRLAYVVCGDMNEAVYFSMTIEEGAQDGDIAKTTGGVINDTEIDIGEDGSFTVYLGGERRERNWLPLGENASRVTTRHYYERPTPAALDPTLEPTLDIECLTETPPPPPPNDEGVAAGIHRVINMVRSRTLDMEMMAPGKTPPFVSITPNAFPEPIPPGTYGLAAADAHYSMAPYLLTPDQALVVTGRWPECRFANVCLWNRFQQTYDYGSRPVSLNRAQTETDADGRFTMILAHEDPGKPNWLDTEGRPFGMVFWRFFLVDGAVETPQARVVPLAELRGS